MEVKEHTTRRDASGNPICNRCNTAITDPNFHIIMFHPEHPSIQIGPLHEDCIPFMKLCTKCFKPCSLFTVESGLKDEAVYVNDGAWLCLDCSAHLEKCDHCSGVITSNPIVVDGKKLCTSCASSLSFKCLCCNEQHMKDSSTHGYALNDVDSLFIETHKVLFKHFNNKICIKCFEEQKDKFPIRKVFRCKCCGNIYEYENEKDDRTYCPLCKVKGKVQTCHICKKNKHQLKFTEDGGVKLYFCIDCLSTKGFCSKCKTFHKEDDIVEVDGLFLKGNSASRSMEDQLLNLASGKIEKITTVCKECAVSFIRCPACFSLVGKIIKYKGLTYCTSCKSTLNACSVCGKFHMQESSCRPNTEILSYSYRPTPFLIYDPKEVIKKSTVIMGIENEVTFNSYQDSANAHTLITTRFGATELYVKGDSSIRGERGFEIVTHPMSFGGMKMFHWNDLFDGIKYKKDSSCGMHVHINRSSFKSKLHLFKFTKFMNSWDKLRRDVAGRDCVSYSQKIEKSIAGICTGKQRVDRYSIVNFQPKHTIEVRIFAGATTAQEILRRLEFLHALHEFSSSTHISATPEDFIAWVKTQKRFTNFNG